jgi:hypothetical protein
MDQTPLVTATSIDPGTLRVGEWAHLMFGFLWRGIVYTIGCMIAGAIVGGIAGGILGAIMGMARYQIADIKNVSGWVGAVLGFAVGFIGLRFYIHWLLRARFGALRLSLVRADATPQ